MSQPRVESSSFTSSAPIDAALSELRLHAAWRRPLRRQIIVPFLLLVVFVAVVGVAALTYQAASAGMAGFDQSLVRASVQVNDRLATLEAGRLNDLRALASRTGLAAALAAGDGPRLSDLYAADVATAHGARVVIRILDAQGNRVLSIPADTAPASYAGLPAIRQVLLGANDGRGDKYAAVVREASGQIVYWAAPVRDPHRGVVGAVLLGESITDIAAEIHGTDAGRLFFYGLDGQPLEGSPPMLSRDVRQSATFDHLMRVSATAGGHTYAIAVADWTVRGERFGYLGVGLPADGAVDGVFKLRVILLLVFVLTALLVLLVGGLLARRISRPLERLVRTVAAGDLSEQAPTRAADEIGYLTSSFSEMTASLEAKTKALETTSFDSIEALARAIDARDPYTYGHSARVARLSFEIADEMGLLAGELIALGRAALLHDIGKIGVEDRVLRKPGPLDKRETAAMREHPVIGYEMLKGLRFLESSLAGVRHHHEHWDGSGYPDGVKGENIPLAVRILTVADALDALTSDRPYRVAMSVPAAVRTIEAAAGHQFDPAVIRTLRSRSAAIAALLTVMGKPRAMPLEVIKGPAR
ncbi:MAG TPA: HD domain-containing phosphohydrolase [Candidatus Dormibacteraeota bacterium]|nr:HD domain-containing phosphohydrolase [Candidatus Dormibacteraeota bacterium]